MTLLVKYQLKLRKEVIEVPSKFMNTTAGILVYGEALSNETLFRYQQ